MRAFAFMAFLLYGDMGFYLSVPSAIRLQNTWSIIPGGGVVLAIKHHVFNSATGSPAELMPADACGSE